jgi:polyisoprenoid-binding protein YceI
MVPTPRIFYPESWRSAISTSVVSIGLWWLLISPVQSQTFNIDVDHTSLVFAVSHSGLSYTYGRFNQCSGQITVDETAENQSFEFTILSNSIDTNNLLRDDHLRGPDFFDVKAFPKITFQSKTMAKVDKNYTAQGILKMHGVEQEIEIKLTEIGRSMGPRGKSRIGFFSKFSIERSEFGMKALPKIVGDQIAITLSFEGVQINPAAGELKEKAADSGKEPRLSQTGIKPSSPFQSRSPLTPTKESQSQSVDQQYRILEE